ncbi:MAG: hypothetical protein ACRDSM_17230, partial [Pseudonocardiaceae bacterium]
VTTLIICGVGPCLEYRAPRRRRVDQEISRRWRLLAASLTTPRVVPPAAGALPRTPAPLRRWLTARHTGEAGGWLGVVISSRRGQALPDSGLERKGTPKGDPALALQATARQPTRGAARR